jgi:D-alanyl-D-alanine carboxypeptidase
MKNFFITVFGGMFAIAFGVGVAFSATYIWKSFGGKVIMARKIEITAAAGDNSVSKQKVYISDAGSKNFISALDEEDLVNAVLSSMPKSADKNVTATGYMVKNLVRGDVVIKHNSETLLPIASLTKLVTAIVAKRYMSSDDKITISKKITATYGSTAGFKVGETYRVKDLLYPLLMVSSNDAAEALADKYGREKFILNMNDFTQSIGAYRTYFKDPSGLSKDNISTAEDLVTIIDWIYKNEPEIIEITKMKSKTVRSHTWINPTHFLSWSYYLGGKNGYTPEANRTSVSLFSLGKSHNPYAVVVLGSNSRDNDVTKLIRKVKD